MKDYLDDFISYLKFNLNYTDTTVDSYKRDIEKCIDDEHMFISEFRNR